MEKYIFYTLIQWRFSAEKKENTCQWIIDFFFSLLSLGVVAVLKQNSGNSKFMQCGYVEVNFK